MEIHIATMDNLDPSLIALKLTELRVEHRDLDDAISRLVDEPSIDDLQLRRMKKRKLQIKDVISKLESRLIPDMDA